jgi:hypothetical protein
MFFLTADKIAQDNLTVHHRDAELMLVDGTHTTPVVSHPNIPIVVSQNC